MNRPVMQTQAGSYRKIYSLVIRIAIYGLPGSAMRNLPLYTPASVKVISHVSHHFSMTPL